jgi:integrase
LAYPFHDELQMACDTYYFAAWALDEAETVGLSWKIDPSHPQSKHVSKHWKGQRDKLDPHVVAAIRLLMLTGARLREVLGLRWEWIHLERGLIFLPTSKTGRKTIVLNAAALDILQDLAARSRALSPMAPRARIDRFGASSSGARFT